MFEINDKVICVFEFEPQFAEYHSELPIKNQIYVVRMVREGILIENGKTAIGLGLVGIQGKFTYDGLEFLFSGGHFRKLDEVKEENSAKNKKSEPAQV